ncbi:MAG: hypothetical protein LC749_00960 [Actinobacteria bacterium]|nr:hypothetical protein [Actinomycetota bacterium]
MRALRVAADPVQLALPDLDLPEEGSVELLEPWWELPEATRVGVLALLARLIARCVLVDVALDGGEFSDD